MAHLSILALCCLSLLRCGGGTAAPAPAPPPTITQFTASPSQINLGGSSTLGWSVSGATTLRIDPSVGAVSGTATLVVPIATTAYTLTATGAGGTASAQVTVTVAPLTPSPVLPASITNGIDTIYSFANGANSGKPGGMVAVALDGKLIYQKAYGMAQVAEGVPSDVGAPYYLASTSKQFTAMAVLLCQERGWLKTTDELRTHFPDLDPVFDGIKLQNLLNMNSSIYDVGTGNQTATTAQMYQTLKDEGAYGVVVTERPAGSVYKYTNMNYALLALIVEKVSGQSFRRFVQTEIFDKLGMSHSVVHDDPALAVPGQPHGYDENLTLWSTAATTSPAFGMTGVITTVNDLLLWDENFYANQLGSQSQALITLMEKPSLGNYACGLIVDTAGGYRRVQHTGRWLGFLSGHYRYPTLRLTVFVLLNRDDQRLQLPGHNIATLFMNTVCFVSSVPAETKLAVPYHHAYSATGAPRPTYSLLSGTLPPGLVLSAAGVLSGTPTTAGTYNGVVQALSGTKSATQNVSLVVAANP